MPRSGLAPLHTLDTPTSQGVFVPKPEKKEPKKKTKKPAKKAAKKAPSPKLPGHVHPDQ